MLKPHLKPPRKSYLNEITLLHRDAQACVVTYGCKQKISAPPFGDAPTKINTLWQ